MGGSWSRASPGLSNQLHPDLVGDLHHRILLGFGWKEFQMDFSEGKFFKDCFPDKVLKVFTANFVLLNAGFFKLFII